MNEEQYDDKCPCCGRLYDLPTPAKKNKKLLEEQFCIFWKSYPRKDGKQNALKAWMKSELPELEVILAALRRACASRDWRKDDGAFIPYPATWINQQRWEDCGMDYDALKVEKPTITSRLQINEEDAFAWRVEMYPDSMLIHPTWNTFPFKDWPKSTQQDYLNSITK
jgi:hypothetical protein